MFNNCKLLDVILAIFQIATVVGFLVIIAGIIFGIVSLVKWCMGL